MSFIPSLLQLQLSGQKATACYCLGTFHESMCVNIKCENVKQDTWTVNKMCKNQNNSQNYKNISVVEHGSEEDFKEI